MCWYLWLCALNPGPPRGLEGLRASIESGAHNIDCGRGLEACPQEVLHALKCVLGASEASFCAYIQYIYTCKLLSLFSSFRLKSMTYWALARGLCSRHVRCVH